MTTSKNKVLVTGVFDILHQEHLNFLRKAAELGEVYLGIESDVRVKKMKGEGRPINGQELRKRNLEALGIAKQVFILPEEFDKPEHHRKLLAEIKPDILAVSSNSDHQDKKASLMQEIGGRLEVVHQHNPDISTTIILQKEKELSGKN